MKVLVYSHSFAPLIGGAETYALLLARGLANVSNSVQPDGIQVTVATPTDRAGFDDSSLPFRVVRQPGLWTLFRLIRQADIVHLVGPCVLPMLLARLVGKPFIVEQHGYQSICPNGLLFLEPTKIVCPGHFMAGRYEKCWKCNRSEGIFRSLKIWMITFVRRWLSNRATVNIAVSHHVQERLRLRNSSVIYYGIPDAIAQTDNTAREHVPPSPVYFAYVGRMVSEKGLGTLLDAAAILRKDGVDFRLRFIGDGPERRALEAQTAQHHLNGLVDFTGFLTGEELQVAIRDVAVTVMPSRCEETAGLSAIEQMMRGRLVMCSDIGGLGEVVDGAGLKFAAEDAEALAALMRRVVQNPEVVAEFGIRARERALKFFALDRMIGEHIDLYRGALGERPLTREPASEF
jgi:glycosyltransferase involved in cell wall biosynthesis